MAASHRLIASVLVPLLSLTVTACQKRGEPDAASAPAIQQAATRTQESISASEPGADRGDVSLERMATLPESAQLPAGRWKPGIHYQPIVPAQPTSAPAGQVEVLEFFWYGSQNSYRLEPAIEAWQAQKAPWIKFLRMPVVWSQGPQQAHARLYYTLEALGKLDALHGAVFDTVQKGGNPLVAESDARTLQLQAQFARSQGIDEADFRKAWDSPAVLAALQRADEFTRRLGIDGVPRIVVNGKYLLVAGTEGTGDSPLQIVDDLAAAEKKR
ncbi:MAG: hypothetical protein RLZZ200_1742 [Pseudomonadota bacterium]|jgi:thiol:disulfide interchange protein DsbA